APDTAAAHPAPPPLPPPVPPAPPPPKPASLRLAMVGDINLGTTTLPDGVPPDSGRGLLDAARPSLVGDLVIGNFRGVPADTGPAEKWGRLRAEDRFREDSLRSRKGPVRRKRPRPKAHRPPADTATVRPGCYAFRTPTSLAPRLVEAGFTHLNLANNH